MSGSKFPVAREVTKDQWGVFCADRRCGMPVFLDRIEAGPRIGIRETYRHTTRSPLCRRPEAQP